MAQLAIKGHATRGKEVIQLLEMLGGGNAYNLGGAETSGFYYIFKDNNKIIYGLSTIVENVIVYTLEEFEEEFPYKVGDEVIAYAEGCLAKFTIQDIRWNYELNKVEYKICSSWLDASLIMQLFKEELTMKKTNIAEILKDCPKGTKLYSPLCGECYFDSLNMGTIICKRRNEQDIAFTSEGYYMLPVFDDCECVLFPSKENRDWSKFQKPFKDGDILTYTSNYTSIFIYRNKENESNYSTSFYVGCSDAPTHNFLIYNKYTLIALNGNCDVRLATEEEKQKLFKAIKDNGYKWNEETKTLEKLIEPKFKVGDRIIKRDSIVNSWIVSSVSSEYYGLQLPKGSDGIGVLPIVEQDDYELLSDIEPKFKKGDKIKHKVNTEWVCTIRRVEDRYYVDGHPTCYTILFDKQNEYELVPNKFDINTLVAFESRVLVRDTNKDKWKPSFWGFYDIDYAMNYPYECCGNSFAQCIPYEGNEHLSGKTDECDEFYKTWK